MSRAIDRRLGREQRHIAVAGDVEREGLGGFIRGARRETCCPASHCLSASVFQYRRVGTLGERRFVVHRRDVDREGLVGRRIVAAVGRATAVHHVQRDDRRTVHVGCRCIGQLSRPVDRRLGREQGHIAVAGDVERKGLGGLSRWSDRKTGGPGSYCLRARIFQDGLVGTLGERRFIVDRRNVKRDRAVGRSRRSLVFDVRGDRCIDVVVRRRCKRNRRQRSVDRRRRTGDRPDSRAWCVRLAVATGRCQDACCRVS